MADKVKEVVVSEPKGVEELSKALADAARGAKETLKWVLESETKANAAQETHKSAVQKLNDLKAKLDAALADHLKVE